MDTTITDSVTVQKREQISLYTRAIDQYLQAVYEQDKSGFDTLFFGRHPEFPDIQLPPVIRNTHIVLLTQEEADKRRKRNPSLVFINMFGWIEKGKAEFMLVTFFPGYRHQFDYIIEYTYDSMQKAYLPESVRLEKLIYNAAGKPERIAVYKNGRYVTDKPIDGNKK